MTTQTRRQIIGLLISVLMTLLMLDALLYWIDPLGIVAARHGNHDFNAVMIDDPTGYALQPGTHRFHNWSATILDDHSRAVPDTNTNADCTIATIGDSVTFGQGVSDSDTWVNQLASWYQVVHFINPARPDYSAVNVAALKNAYPADGYLWLIIGNDAIDPYVYYGVRPLHPYPPATALYRAWLVNQLRGERVVYERPLAMATYWQAVDTIASDNTLLIGFDDDPLAQATAERYPVQLIPHYTGTVSMVDAHANATGNRQIAEAIRPYIGDLIMRVCDAE